MNDLKNKHDEAIDLYSLGLFCKNKKEQNNLFKKAFLLEKEFIDKYILQSYNEISDLSKYIYFISAITIAHRAKLFKERNELIKLGLNLKNINDKMKQELKGIKKI